MERQTDRHTATLYRNTNGQTDRHLLLCTEILTDRRTDRHPNTLYRITNGYTDRYLLLCTEILNRQTYRHPYTLACVCMCMAYLILLSSGIKCSALLLLSQMDKSGTN